MDWPMELPEEKENIPPKEGPFTRPNSPTPDKQEWYVGTEDYSQKILQKCAMTKEDWEDLDSLPEEDIKAINANGLLGWLGFAIINGDLLHISQLAEEMEEISKMEAG